MIGASINEEFDQYIHNTELAPFIADRCTQHYYFTQSFNKEFEYHSRNSRVVFHLYDRSYGMSLEEFGDACKIPYWGSLGEPQKSDYDMFLHCHCNGEDMGSTQARIKSIQFPSIRYFALFNGNCITSKQDRSALCAPALTCLKPYNLGEIVARRLHRNAGSGHLC